mgnify:CR=1 FL=1
MHLHVVWDEPQDAYSVRVFLAGVLRAAVLRAALGVAPVVVHAMLAGIGITIVLQQVHVLMGGVKSTSSV